jgi:hypothetical protein
MNPTKMIALETFLAEAEDVTASEGADFIQWLAPSIANREVEREGWEALLEMFRDAEGIAPILDAVDELRFIEHKVGVATGLLTALIGEDDLLHFRLVYAALDEILMRARSARVRLNGPDSDEVAF